MWRNIIPTIFEFKIVHFQVGWNKVEKQEPGWMFLPIMGSILKHDCDLREDLCSAATKWETWSGLIRRQIVGSDPGWVRKGQETFLGDINITSWLRHCQAELTRNNIDIANPDCPLVWHITPQISEIGKNLTTRQIIISARCLGFLLCVPVRRNKYSLTMVRDVLVSWWHPHIRGSITLCQLGPRHICHNIVLSLLS